MEEDKNGFSTVMLDALLNKCYKFILQLFRGCPTGSVRQIWNLPLQFDSKSKVCFTVLNYLTRREKRIY